MYENYLEGFYVDYFSDLEGRWGGGGWERVFLTMYLDGVDVVGLDNRIGLVVRWYSVDFFFIECKFVLGGMVRFWI